MTKAGKGLFGLFRPDSASSEGTQAPRKATLYTRSGCHLCDDAKQVLERNGFCVEEIDVDGDDRLRKEFGLCVPVVSIEGRVRFRGRVDERLLRRLMANET